MTWVKFEHGTPHNRKVAPLSDRAFRCWINMVCWSVGSVTDGVIRDDIPTRLFTDSRTPRKVIEELWDAGLLDRIENGYMIHDFADYQLSGAEQKMAREAAAKRKRDERARRLSNHGGIDIDEEVTP